MRFKTLNYLLGAYLLVATVFVLEKPLSKQATKWWSQYRTQGAVLGIGTPPAEDDNTPVLWVMRIEGYEQYTSLPQGFDVQKNRMAQFRILPDGNIEFIRYLDEWIGEQP